MATRRGNRWIVWILVALIALGFGGWFAGGPGGRRATLATVGDLEITVQDYANALSNQMRAIEGQTGQPMTVAQAQALGLDRAVLGQLVSERVLDAEARRLGLSVGDLRVAQAVRDLSAFQGLSGEFDREVYREQLRRLGLSEGDFETSLREDTTRTILQAAVISGLPEPTAYGEALAAYGNERRSATWAALDASSVAVLPQPSEEELRAFYEANPGLFTAPETREISYAWITPEMVQADIAVDDQAVRDLYDSRLDDYVQEERRLVERLVFPSEEAAQDARARLDAGEADFEALVEERGLLLSDTDLGDVARDDLDDAAEPVFAAEPGEVVGPLPTSLGPAFFRVNAVLAADEVPFEEAEPDLRSELQNERAREAIADIRPAVEDLLAGGATVEDLAERTELEAGTIAWTEGSTEGPAAYSAFREAAAVATEGAFPEIVDLEDGGLFVLRLDAVTPPALRPFDDVQEEVRQAWTEQALRERVLARAEAAAEAIAGGASFEDQLLTGQEESSLTRRSAVEGTTPDFIPAVFEMQPGEARAIPTEDGAIVVRLDTMEAAPLDDPNVKAERAAIASQVSGSIAQDLFAAYASSLQTGTEIFVDDRTLAAIHAQLN